MLQTLRKGVLVPQQPQRQPAVYRDPFDRHLGPASTRYFGEGFRRVEHHISDLKVDATQGTARAVATVQYNRDWSSKSGRPQAAHLSSVDAIVLAVTLVEEYLRHACGLSEKELGVAWVQSVDVRAGSTPLTTLDGFPIEAQLEHLAPDDNAAVSRLRASLGPLSVVMSVHHPTARQPAQHPAQALAGMDPAPRIYGELHKTARIPVSKVHVEDGLCTATIDLNAAPPTPAVGLESEYESSAHVIGMVVMVAQMAQVLLYSMDGLSRDESETLWMRRINITVASPARHTTLPLDVKVRAQKAQIVDMRSAGQWRVSEFLLEELCGISGTTSVAHQISSAPALLEVVST